MSFPWLNCEALIDGKWVKEGDRVKIPGSRFWWTVRHIPWPIGMRRRYKVELHRETLAQWSGKGYGTMARWWGYWDYVWAPVRWSEPPAAGGDQP